MEIRLSSIAKVIMFELPRNCRECPFYREYLNAHKGEYLVAETCPVTTFPIILQDVREEHCVIELYEYPVFGEVLP